MHLHPYDDELCDLMVLPRPDILQELHILFAVIQLRYFKFFLRVLAFLGGLGLISHAFLWSTFTGPLRQIDGGVSVAMGGVRESNTWNMWHEGMREKKWHLIWHG